MSLPSIVSGSGQSFSDRVNAARYAIAGQGVNRVVCKATTEEMLGPKKKHLDYLLQCTHEPNVSIPCLANLLIERTLSNNNWIVVFKSLITVHHLMCYGNERFTQYLATASSAVFPPALVQDFVDKTQTSIEMSSFVRRYAKFLNAKAAAYRSLGSDPTRMRGSGSLRNMSGDQILKTLPVLQNLLDSLLEFDAHPRDLSNGVMTSAFVLLYRDLIRLFACFNDGIINLLEKFFSFRSKKETRAALDLYKRFLIRMDRVAEFLKTAEAVGIDKGDIPDLTRAPSSLLQALESHVAAMDPVPAPAKAKNSEMKAALEEEARYLSLIAAERRHVPPIPAAPEASLLLDQRPSLPMDEDSWPTPSSSRLMTQDILSLFESNSASCLKHTTPDTNPFSCPPAPSLFEANFASAFPAASLPSSSSLPHHHAAAASSSLNSLPGVAELFPSFSSKQQQSSSGSFNFGNSLI